MAETATFGTAQSERSLAPQAGLQVVVPLLDVAVHERVVAAGDQAPEPTRDLPELLVDEDLLEERPALAADLSREAAAVQVGLDGPGLDLAGDVGLDPATARLEFDLERAEDLTSEAARSILQLELSGAQREVHGRKDGARDKRNPRAVAGRETVILTRR